MKEVLSPLGFTKSSQILSAHISEEAQVVDLGKVVNHQIPKTPKLPKTGVSAGILAGSATGLFLLGMVLVRCKRTKLQ